VVSEFGPSAREAISAILKDAGFPLSNYGLEAHEWQRATPGYTAWRSLQPGGVYVVVQYTAAAGARAKLEECAAVLRAAGYAVAFRDRGEEPPWLVIPAVATAPEGSQ
jgi:hypothetical protein